MLDQPVEPRRVVVELTADQFEALERASGRVAPADFLRLVALGLAAASDPRAQGLVTQIR